MNEDEKVVLVTGAATGIGASIAKHFLDLDYGVHVCDQNTASLKKFLESYPKATGSICDVSSSDEVKETINDLEVHYGKLDVLINNAGISGGTALTENISLEDWNDTINVNLNGMFYFAKFAIPLLKKNKRASVINISSTAGLFGVPQRSPYAASKWGVIGFTKTLAMELGPNQINVNAICPGCVDGERIEGVIKADAKESGYSYQQIKDVYLRQSSMRSFADKNDIAAMCYFLCSKSGSQISGQAIAIDGNTEGLFNWLE